MVPASAPPTESNRHVMIRRSGMLTSSKPKPTPAAESGGRPKEGGEGGAGRPEELCIWRVHRIWTNGKMLAGAQCAGYMGRPPQRPGTPSGVVEEGLPAATGRWLTYTGNPFCAPESVSVCIARIPYNSAPSLTPLIYVTWSLQPRGARFRVP